MNVIYTEQSEEGLETIFRFLIEKQGFSLEKASEIKTELLDRADSLSLNPKKGSYEKYLDHLNEGHRKIISHHIKIIYKIESENIYITDFFDTRQDPSKMKR